MTTILSLPDEIYTIILNYEFIQPEDVLNFSCTCRRFQNVIVENDIWRKMFFKKLSHLKRIYDVLELTCINYEEQMRLSIETRKKLHQYLSKMPETHYCMTTLFAPEEIEEFLPVFYPPAGANPLSYYFLMDELTTILKKYTYWSEEDFGEQHYAHKLLYCIQIYYLRYEWHNFMSRSKQQQILETAVGIVDQWFELYDCQQYDRTLYSYDNREICELHELLFPLMWNKSLYIRYMLDKYAEKVLETIGIEYPKHSVLSVSKHQFLFWKDNDTYDCHWDKVEGLQILEAIYKVLRTYITLDGKEKLEKELDKEEDKFILSCMIRKYVSPEMYCKFRPFLDCSSRFTIVFEGLARRFGIWLFDMRESFLAWKPQYGVEDDTYFSIDIHAKTMRGISEYFTTEQFPFTRLDYTFITNKINGIKVFDEKIYSLERYCILQFKLLLEPDNILLLRYMYDYCKVTNANTSMLLDALHKCKDPCGVIRNLRAKCPEMNLDTSKLPFSFDYVQQRQITPKYRTENVNRIIKYAVGMFVFYTNRYYNTFTHTYDENVGIICGWYTNFHSLPEIAKKIIIFENNRLGHSVKENVPYYRIAIGLIEGVIINNIVKVTIIKRILIMFVKMKFQILLVHQNGGTLVRDYVKIGVSILVILVMIHLCVMYQIQCWRSNIQMIENL